MRLVAAEPVRRVAGRQVTSKLVRWVIVRPNRSVVGAEPIPIPNCEDILEDRRVLLAPEEMQVEAQCVDSVSTCGAS